MPEMVVDKPQVDVDLVAPKQRFELPEEQPKAPEPAAAPTGENTGEQATPTKPEGEKPETEKDDPEKRGTRRFERRIQKAYREAAEQKARADFIEKRLQELESQSKGVATSDPGAPTLEQHGFDPEKYAEARATHEKNKAIREYQSRQAQESQQQALARVSASWEEKVTKAEDKYEDFDEKVGKLDPRHPVIASMMESELGADIAYYLGSHPEEAKKILSSPPLSAIREIGRLEAKLSSTPEKPKAPSKAPAPITPVTGTAPVATSQPSENDDIKDWIRKRQRQVHGKR